MFFNLFLLNLFSIVFTKLHNFPTYHPDELEAKYWEGLANADLLETFHRKDINRKAKNVILFIGGGMGLSTITPARILKGQLKNSPGEEAKLTFEDFPNTCLLKTYAVDNQVTDAAAAANALLYGVKSNTGTIGVSARVKQNADCEAVQKFAVHSLFDTFYEADMSTGIVTNNRITYATPAAAYATVGDRDWEGSIPSRSAINPNGLRCIDIARQIVESHPGRNINVILGGGGRFLYPKNYTDPINKRVGQREDGLNIVEKWTELRRQSGMASEKFRVVHNRSGLLSANEDHQSLEYLFGVFNDDNLNYDQERDEELEPSLEEMTDTAINVLKKNERGFLLLVDGGRIDHAHHANYANHAMYETLALDMAVDGIFHLVSSEETLVVVTATHSHSLTMNGYPIRGHNIMGIAGLEDGTRVPFTTLMYTTGPGYTKNRTDPSNNDTSALRYQSHSAVYLETSSHTGEDVALYSIGPMSHLFRGTKDNTYVSHALAFAACIGNYSTYEHCNITSDEEVQAMDVQGDDPISFETTSIAFIGQNNSINFLISNILILAFNYVFLKN